MIPSFYSPLPATAHLIQLLCHNHNDASTYAPAQASHGSDRPIRGDNPSISSDENHKPSTHLTQFPIQQTFHYQPLYASHTQTRVSNTATAIQNFPSSAHRKPCQNNRYLLITNSQVHEYRFTQLCKPLIEQISFNYSELQNNITRVY